MRLRKRVIQPSNSSSCEFEQLATIKVEPSSPKNSGFEEPAKTIKVEPSSPNSSDFEEPTTTVQAEPSSPSPSSLDWEEPAETVKVEASSSSSSEFTKPGKPVKVEFKIKKESSSSNKSSKTLTLSKFKMIKAHIFKKKLYIDIRKYYEDNGEMKPTKQGIALTPDEWNALKNNIAKVDAMVKRLLR